MTTPTPSEIYQLHVSADSGNAEAQYVLANAYYNGNGVPRNMGEGSRWLQAAAEGGLARAQCDLGAMHMQKNAGVKQSYEEALLWLRRAAKQGDALALNNLGIINAKGFRDYTFGFFDRVRFANATTDHVEAYKWFTLAAEKGYAAALKDRAFIEARMSSAQIDRAKYKVNEFKQAKNPWVDGFGRPYE